MDAQRIDDGIHHRHGWIEAGQWVLEHHLNGPPRLAGFTSPQPQQILAEELHPAATNRRESHQGTAEGAFATARTSHYSEGFASSQLEADAVYRFQPGWIPGWTTQVVPAAQFLHGQHRVGVGCFRGAAPFSSAGSGQQPLSHSGAGIGQDHIAAVDLHDATTVQHCHAFAPAIGHGQIVGDQQQSTTKFLTQRSQSSHHLPCHGHIQACGGFVRNH